VRRGFEFGPDRPAFILPLAQPLSQTRQARIYLQHCIRVLVRCCLESWFQGSFRLWLIRTPTRPSSDDMSFSMSMSVDDTFDFMHRDSRRRRVDSDASSFYFTAPGVTQMMHPPKRGHRRQESNMSTASIAPPISIYNRSFGAHRRNDSNSSTSSIAQSYAMFGTAGGRASWPRHRKDMSIDSILSDLSAMRLSRPGLGDKMLDSARDYRMPLIRSQHRLLGARSASASEIRRPSTPLSTATDHSRRIPSSIKPTSIRLHRPSPSSVRNDSFPRHTKLPANHFRRCPC